MAAAPRASAWKRNMSPSAPPPYASCSVRSKERKRPPASGSGAGAHSAPACRCTPAWHEPEYEQQKGACVSAACVALSTRAKPTACHADSSGKYGGAPACSTRAATVAGRRAAAAAAAAAAPSAARRRAGATELLREPRARHAAAAAAKNSTRKAQGIVEATTASARKT